MYFHPLIIHILKHANSQSFRHPPTQPISIGINSINHEIDMRILRKQPIFNEVDIVIYIIVSRVTIYKSNNLYIRNVE